MAYRVREKPVETDAVKIGKDGKDKKAKKADGKPLAAGESEFAKGHWDKVVVKLGSEKKVLEALGATDDRKGT